MKKSRRKKIPTYPYTYAKPCTSWHSTCIIQHQRVNSSCYRVCCITNIPSALCTLNIKSFNEQQPVVLAATNQVYFITWTQQHVLTAWVQNSLYVPAAWEGHDLWSCNTWFWSGETRDVSSISVRPILSLPSICNISLLAIFFSQMELSNLTDSWWRMRVSALRGVTPRMLAFLADLNKRYFL